MLSKLRLLERLEARGHEDGEPLRRETGIDMDELLAHLQSPTTGRRVLISKTYLDEETMVFDIRVVSKHMPDEDVYDEAEVINCHVCNVVVPRAYFRVHAQSGIHQSNKKISALFIENLLSDYTLLAHDIMKNRPFNSFYCSSCARLVPDDQTLAHGLSVEHFKSTDKKSALDVFVKMFIDKKPVESKDLDDILFYEMDYDEVDSEGIASGSNDNQPSEIPSGSNCNQPAETASWSNSYQAAGIASGPNPEDCQPEGRLALLVHNRAKENELNAMQPTTSINETVSDTNEPYTSNTDQSYNVVDNTGVSSEIQEFKQYAKSMRDKYGINVCDWIKVDDPCHLTVAAPNGNILKITVDIFHSFAESSSFVLCMVCDKLFALDAKKLHIANEKHARLISRPIDNMFRRKINGLWSHDLVSNKYYGTRPEDSTTEGNDKRPPVNNTPTVSEPPTLVNKNNIFVNCEVCNINIHGHNFAAHLQGKNHRQNQKKIDKQNIKATQNSVQTQEHQQEYGSTQDQVDDRNGPMDVEAFMVYLKKMVSKYNLKYTLPIVKNGGLVVVTSQGLEAAITVESFHGYKPTESSMYCQLCEMTISVNTKVHSETRIHVKNITQNIDIHFTRKISVVMSHCLLCNITVSDSAEHAATDPTHYSHVKDRVFNLKQMECPTDKKRKLTHCDVCNIYLTPNTYREHLKGQRHLQTVREYSEQRETPANMIFCPICLRTIHCNSFQEHCKGKRHNALAKRKARESQTQCEPTDQVDTAHSSLTTVNQHETNFLEYLKSMIAKFKLNCELPIVEDGGVVIMTPNGNREKFTIEAFHSYKQAESSVVCQVCRMNVLSKDTRAHSVTRLHVVNILKPVDNNFSRKINKSWNHCLVCNITVLNNFDHASYSPIHKQYNQVDASPRDGGGEGNAEKIFCNDRYG